MLLCRTNSNLNKQPEKCFVYKDVHSRTVFINFFLLKYLFLAALGLSCMWDLFLWRTGLSLVVALRVTSCGLQASLPWGMWYHSSPAGNGISVPALGGELNHWTTREVPLAWFLKTTYSK